MKRIVAFLGALAAAALLHFAATLAWSDFPRAVDLFLLVAVLEARHGEPLSGMFAGLAAGLVADALSGGLYGLYGFADTAIGFIIARAAQRLVIQRTSSQAFIFAAGAAGQQAILAALALLLLRSGELASPEWMLVKVASTGLLGLAWTVGVERFSRRLLSRRRGRRSGIRRP